jgi:hypothetical protein
MAIVIQEILQDKIYLDLVGNVQVRSPGAADLARGAVFMDGAGPSSED